MIIGTTGDLRWYNIFMTDYASKTDLNNLEKRLDKRFDELTALMSGFANDVNARFDGVDKNFVSIDGRLTKIEAKLTEHDEELRKLNKKYDHLVSTIDAFIARIDTYETELAARDHKIDRLERWIQQIAAKTDIKLT